MSELLTAIALAVALEGIIYALFPGIMRRVIRQVLKMPDAELRMAGLTGAVAALAAIATIRFFSVEAYL